MILATQCVAVLLGFLAFAATFDHFGEKKNNPVAGVAYLAFTVITLGGVIAVELVRS